MQVLIADDDPVARTILEKMTSAVGFDVISVSNGSDAWEIIQGDVPPRIALLDWMMPEPDGIEICRRLSERPEGKPLIYAIVLTASTEREKLVEALRAGAHDFQFKPVDPQELQCRLKVARRLIEADDSNRQYAMEMESLAELRARQLIHADRLVALGTLSAGIAHEINNPMGFISGNVQIIQKMWPEVKKCMLYSENSDVVDKNKLDFIVEELPGALEGIDEGVRRVISIVKGLKAFSRGESDQPPEPYDLNEVVSRALMLCRNVVGRNIRIEKCLDSGIGPLIGHPMKIVQVLVNLVTNAVDALERTEEPTINISTFSSGEKIYLKIEDNGSGVPNDKVSSIFNPFFTTKPVGKGTGLGLSIAYGIINDHGGELRYEGNSAGAVFVVELPASGKRKNRN